MSYLIRTYVIFVDGTNSHPDRSEYVAVAGRLMVVAWRTFSEGAHPAGCNRFLLLE